jgi:Putative restriction endonuclease
MITAIGKAIPPLAAGDKLTRHEFLHRWEGHPEIKCAELLGGLVYMPSPVSVDHGDMEAAVGTWLGTYAARTLGTACGHNTTAFLLEDTPQPDLNLRILPEYGGGSRVEEGYLQGPAEFLAEICRSSASYDLHVKLNLYQKARVPEYLAGLLFEQEIRWHMLVDGSYRLLSPEGDAVFRSKVFPGLWLDGPALLAGNLQRVLSRLDQGL